MEEVRISLNPLGSGLDMHGTALAAILLQRLGGETTVTVAEFEWFMANRDKALVINAVEGGRSVAIGEKRHGEGREPGDTGV